MAEADFFDRFFAGDASAGGSFAVAAFALAGVEVPREVFRFLSTVRSAPVTGADATAAFWPAAMDFDKPSRAALKASSREICAADKASSRVDDFAPETFFRTDFGGFSPVAVAGFGEVFPAFTLPEPALDTLPTAFFETALTDGGTASAASPAWDGALERASISWAFVRSREWPLPILARASSLS